MQSQKRFICSKCGKELANRHNLSRHKKSCQSAPYNIPVRSPTYNPPTQPPPPTSVADAAVKESSVKHRLTNPKIQSLLDEIINDDDPDRNVTPQPIYKGFSIVPPTTTSHSSKPSTDDTAVVLPSTPTILPNSKSSSRTKGDIVGYSNDESSEKEDSSESEESIASKSDGDDNGRRNLGLRSSQILYI